MRAWLITLLCLGFVSQAFAAPGPGLVLPLNMDALLSISSRLGFADLYQASYVSKGFCALTGQAVKKFYTIRHKEKLYLNYTTILHELDALIQATGKGRGAAEATMDLMASPQFACIRSILEARFGYCIRFANGRLPEFNLLEPSLDILNDMHKVAALPYVLDQNSRCALSIAYIRELAGRGRVDLLNQLAFSGINYGGFRQLMSIPLPEAVVLMAAKCLQKNDPALQFSKTLGLVGLGDQAASLPENSLVPLFLMPYLYGESIVIPASCIFSFGLSASSISFWMYLMMKKREEAQGLVASVLQHGDSKTRHLASTFIETVSGNQLDGQEKDDYQALLTRF